MEYWQHLIFRIHVHGHEFSILNSCWPSGKFEHIYTNPFKYCKCSPFLTNCLDTALCHHMLLELLLLFRNATPADWEYCFTCFCHSMCRGMVILLTSVKINYTFLQEIHIIPEYIITKQSGYEPVCILCWCTDLGAAQYLCQRGTCGWLLSIPNIITWNSRGWTLIQEKVKEYQKQYLTNSHSFYSETSVYGSSSPA